MKKMLVQLMIAGFLLLSPIGLIQARVSMNTLNSASVLGVNFIAKGPLLPGMMRNQEYIISNSATQSIIFHSCRYQRDISYSLKYEDTNRNAYLEVYKPWIALKLKHDANTYNVNTGLEWLWDGIPNQYQQIYHTARGSTMPHIFSFDLGYVYNHLTQFEEWGRQDPANRSFSNATNFEVWGIADTTDAIQDLPPDDAGWEAETLNKGWTLLAHVVRTDDGIGSVKVNLIDNPPPVRFIRIRVLGTIDNNSEGMSSMSELSFWYYPKESNALLDQELIEYTEVLNSANWNITQLSESIVWKFHHFIDFFSARQSMNIFDVDLNKGNVAVEIPYVTTGYFQKTSEAAASVNATAAINGSYFDTKEGGSSAFFVYCGDIVVPSTFIAPWRSNAGLSIGRDGEVAIVRKPASGWKTTKNTYHLLASGPLLVSNGIIQHQISSPYNYNLYPRTAIGLTKDNRLITVVVDGRSSESYGLTIGDLAKVMKALGCDDAMSMDSGGSVTAWVKNEGVVNYPSDNRRFDHQGERAICTVVAFVMK